MIPSNGLNPVYNEEPFVFRYWMIQKLFFIKLYSLMFAAGVSDLPLKGKFKGERRGKCPTDFPPIIKRNLTKGIKNPNKVVKPVKNWGKNVQNVTYYSNDGHFSMMYSAYIYLYMDRKVVLPELAVLRFGVYDDNGKLLGQRNRAILQDLLIYHVYFNTLEFTKKINMASTLCFMLLVWSSNLQGDD